MVTRCEPLEERVMLTPDVYLVPGSDTEQVDVSFLLTQQETKFKNEIGVFIVDNAAGAVGGHLPGSSEYARAVIQSADRHILFPSGGPVGVTSEITVAGGTYLAFYLVKKHSSESLLDRANKQKFPNTPKIYFSSEDVSQDRFDHVRSSSLGNGSIEYQWKDSKGGKDEQFNDAVYTVTTIPPLTAPTVSLLYDTGTSDSDHVTADPAVTGTASANTVILEAAFDPGTGTPVYHDVTRTFSNGNFTLTAADLAIIKGAALSDGTYTLLIRSREGGERISPIISISFTLDTVATPPSLALINDTGTSNSDGITSDFSVSGSAVDNSGIAKVELALDEGATPVFHDITGYLENGQFILATADLITLLGGDLADGTYRLLVRERDVAGSVSSMSAVQFVLDQSMTTPTATLTNDTGVSGNDLLTADPTVQGAISDLNGVSALEAALAESDATTFYDVTQRMSDGHFTLSKDDLASILGEPLIDGTYQLRVRARDIAGNLSTTEVLSFTLDTAVADPQVSLLNDTGVDSTDRLTSDPTLQGTLSDPGIIVAVEAALDVAGTGIYQDITNLVVDGAFTLTAVELSTLLGAPLVDGHYVFNVRARDAAGNVSGDTSLSFTFTLDTAANTPTIGLANDTGASTSDRVTSDPTIHGTANDANGVAKLEVAFDVGTAPVFHDVTARLTDGNFSLTPVDLAAVFGNLLSDGDYRLLLQKRDIAGNVSGVGVLQFTLDSTIAPPTLSLANDTGISNTDHVTSDPTLQGTVADLHGVTKLEGGFDRGDPIAFHDITDHLSDGTFTLSAAALATLLGEPLVDGDYRFVVRAHDNAGNTSSQTALAFTLAADVIVGIVTLDLAHDTGSSSSDQLSLDSTVHGTATSNIGIPRLEAAFDAGETLVFRDISEALIDGTFTLTSDALATILGSPLVDGNYQLVVRTKDDAGNVTGANELTFTLDTAVNSPNLALANDTGDSTSDQLTADATVQGLAGDLHGVAMLELAFDLGGAPVFHDVSSKLANGSFLLSPADLAVVRGQPLNDGTYTLLVRMRDAAGNLSPTGSLIFTLDTVVTAPTAGLVNDTGISSTDRLTSDPTLNGTAFDLHGIATLEAALDLGTIPIFHDLTANLIDGVYQVTASDLAVLRGSPLTDGNYRFLARLRDAAGNVSENAALNFAFTLDTTATPPTLNLAHDTGASNTDRLTSDPTVAGLVSDNHGIVALNVAIDTGAALVFHDITNTLINQHFTLTATELATFLGSSVADGAYRIVVQAQDVAGNISALTALVFTLDTTAPANAVDLTHDTGVSSSDHITSDSSIHGTTTDAHGISKFEVAFDLGGSPNFHDLTGSLQNGQFNLSAGDLAEVLGESLVDGNYRILVRSTDFAGNISPATQITFTLDTNASPPSVGLSNDTGASATDGVTSDAAIQGIVHDTNGISRLEAAFDLDGNPVFVDITSYLNGNAFTLTIADLATLLDAPLIDGDFRLVFRTIDGAGNRSNTTAVEFTLDRTVSRPTLALLNDTGLSATDGITSDPTVNGAISPNQSIVRLEAAFDTGGILAYHDVTAALNEGVFTLTPADLVTAFGGQLFDGNYTLLVRAVDSAGNASDPASLTFVLDASAPLPPEFDLSIGSDTGEVGDQQTAAGRVTITGLADPTSSLTMVQTGQQTLVGISGSFLIPNITLQPGANSITLASKDIAGNVSSNTHTFVKVESIEQSDPVLDWNAQAIEAIRLDSMTPAEASRVLAIMHSAILDAVNSVEGTPGRYVSLATPAGTSMYAAVAVAAEHVLAYYFPAQETTFGARLTDSLSQVSDGIGKSDGIALGQNIADALIQIREQDGYDAFGEYFGGTDPGQWRPTAPMFAVAQLPEWGNVQPFVISSVGDFQVPGPPELSSQEWANAYNEIKDLGSATSTIRTAEQTQIAKFWSDGAGTYTPPGHWNQIAEVVARDHGSSLADNARLFAELNVAMADAGIVCWAVKYEDGFWRPITAIQEGDLDGNDETVASPDWMPLLVTPPFPEYISGHSTFSAAAATVLTSIFGDNVGFTVGSVTPQNFVRSFTSFDEAASEAAISRLYGGIHYSFSINDGMDVGQSIGQAVIQAFSVSSDTQAPTIILNQVPSATNQNAEIQGQMLDNLLGLQSAAVAIDDGEMQALAPDSFGRFVFATTFATDGTDDGSHVFHFQAIDTAGNVATADLSLILDTQLPEIAIASLADNDDLASSHQLAGTVDGTGSPIVRLTYAFDGGPVMPFGLADDSSLFDTQLDISGLNVGQHSLVVSAEDAAGNVSQSTLQLQLTERAAFNITSYTPTPSAEDVGVTYRPQIYFSRPVDPTSLNSSNLFATDASGIPIPATIVPASDSTFAWLFFNQPLAGASTVTMHVNGATIQAAADDALLDADSDGTAGGELTWTFSTVSLAGLAGTSLAGTLADPWIDLKMGTFDDVRPGPDGILMTGDDVYLHPIQHVKLFVLGLEDQAVFSDASGNFVLNNIPAGTVKVVVDGRTAVNAPSGIYFPEMVMDLNIRPAEQNTMMSAMQSNLLRAQAMTERGVYLPRLQTSLLADVSDTESTTVGVDALSAPDLTPLERQYLTLTVEPGSILGADGQPLSNPQIGISTVPPEMVQDMLPAGLREQHTFEITIQAPGATVFQTPVQITFPNLNKAAPGSQVNIFSFDHTTGLVVLDGTGTVSPDGLFVTSDPGSGIRAPGWHFVQVGTNAAGQPALPNEVAVQVNNALLGDIIKVDLSGTHGRDFQIATPSAADGYLAKVDNWQSLLSEQGIFYFVPAFSNDDSRFTQSPKTIDLRFSGIGNLATDPPGTPERRISFLVQFKNLLPGYSSSGPSALIGSSSILDVYRLQHRLRYLGYPDGAGFPLVESGVVDSNTQWAIDLFDAAAQGRRTVTPGTTLNLSFANAINAPIWKKLPVAKPDGSWFFGDPRENENWGTSWAQEVLDAAAVENRAAGSQFDINVNDISVTAGGPTDHNGHQTGIDIDIRLQSPGLWYDIDTIVPLLNDYSNAFWRAVNPLNPLVAFSAITDGKGSYTGKYDAANGWRVDQAIIRLYSHRGIANDAFNNKISELGDGDFDTGFDKLAGRSAEYNRQANIDHILAFANAATPSGAKVSSIFFNDPVAIRLIGSSITVTPMATHGNHFHVNVVPPDVPRSTSHLIQQVSTLSSPSVSLLTSIGADSRLFYRFALTNGFEVGGRSEVSGRFQQMLTPNTDYTLYVYQASTNSSAVYHGRTNNSGVVTDVGTIILDQFGGIDSDDDGLPDIAEITIGTSSNSTDTDGDGIDDATEIEQGLDPLDDRGFPTGIIASVPLSGSAQEVVVDGSTAYLAAGSAGVAIVDVTRFDKPILLSQLTLGGTANDVAVDSQLGIAVVANSGNLVFVDVSLPLAPVVLQTLQLPASRVDIVDGIAYVASGANLVSVDLTSGEVLQTLALGSDAITDIVHEGRMLYTMDASRRLRAIDISAPEMIVCGSIVMPVGGRKIFVGNGVAYVAANDFQADGGFATAAVSDPDHLSLLGFTRPPDRRPGSSIAVNGSGLALLVGTQVEGTQGATPRINIMDVQDLTQTDSILLNIDLPASPRGVAIASGIAFVADGTGGLKIVNYLPFDSRGVAPTATISAPTADLDGTKPGTQVLEGSSVTIRADVTDDVQVRNAELLVNGIVVQNDVSFPWDFSVIALSADSNSNVVAVQVRVTDTGGNISLTNIIDLEVVPDTFAPEITSTEPIENSSSIELRTSIAVRFSEPMDTSTITPSTIRIRDGAGQFVALTNLQIQFDGTVARLTFAPLLAGDYQIVFDAAAITDRAGNTLGTGEEVKAFTLTRRAVLTNTTPDEVPNVAGLQVTEGTLFGMQFHLTIPNVTIQSVRLMMNGQQVASSTNAVANFSIRLPIISNDQNSVIFQAQVTDSLGRTTYTNELIVQLLEDPPPQISSTDPLDGSVATRSVDLVNIRFSESVTTSTVSQQAVTLLEAGPDGIIDTADDVAKDITSISFTDSNRVLQIHTSNLGTGHYQVRLATEGIADLVGNQMPPGVFTSDFDVTTIIAVTNTSDDGPGSLRAAITLANAASEHAFIEFRIPDTDPHFVDVDHSQQSGDSAADAFLISLQSPLPALVNPAGITIDGRTQQLFGGNTSPFGPEIVITGSGAGAGADGLQLLSSDNQIFTLAVGGFSGRGIVITGDRNVLEGNYIGTNPIGTASAPNGGGGVLIDGGRDNRIGAAGSSFPGFAVRNVIAYNQGVGVSVKGPTAIDNRIRGNAIFSNTSNAIDLGGDSFTPNDQLDTDSGPNQLQNKPQLTLPIYTFDGFSGSLLRLGGTLHSAPNTVYVIDFYVSRPFPTADRWIDSTTVMTDATGFAEFNYTSSTTVVPVTDYITATATDPAGNTSELSTDFWEVEPPSTLEPNDTLGTAGSVNLSHEHPGTASGFGFIGNKNTFSFGTDVDILSFPLQAGDRLLFDVDTFDGTSQFDSILRLFDSSGNEIAFSDNTAAPGESAGIDPYLEFVATGSGTYYIGVSGQGNAAYNPINGANETDGRFGRYVYKISVIASSPDEPNDSPDFATQTGLFPNSDGIYEVDRAIGDNSAIAVGADVDYYAFDIEEFSSLLYIDVTPASDLNLKVSIVDAFGTPYSPEYQFGAEGLSTTFSTNGPGTYFIRIASSDIAGGGYHLRLSFAQPGFEMDEGETNDSIFSANTIPFFQSSMITVHGAIQPQSFVSDVDLFGFFLLGGQIVTCDIDAAISGSSLDSMLELFDESGNLVAISNDDVAPDDLSGSSDSYLTFMPPGDGYYYLGVSGFGDYYDPFTAGSGIGGSQGTYDLILVLYGFQ